MIKIWTSEERSNDRIIALVDTTLYKCNPAIEEMSNYTQSLNMKIIPDKKTLGIPLGYIKVFRYQEGKKYIQVFFGKDSEEHFRITDDKTRKEIFMHFQQLVPNITPYTHKYTFLQAGKKPLIALLVTSLLFAWTLYLAMGMEAGNQYDVAGQHYHSFAGVVLILANLGVGNVITIFGTLMAIALFAFITKVRNPPRPSSDNPKTINALSRSHMPIPFSLRRSLR